MVVEIQLRRDPDKRWSWPVYLTTLRARLRCPTVLLVVSANAAAATWCAGPIPLGHPGWTLTPLVLGPDEIPVITDIEQARAAPELTVLSAMAHGGQPDSQPVLHALIAALSSVDEERATLYSDVVLAALPAAARQMLEALVATRTYEYQSDFVRKYVVQGRKEGRAEGEVKSLLMILEARGITISDDARARITTCADVPQLDTWIRRAATATSVDDLFV